MFYTEGAEFNSYVRSTYDTCYKNRHTFVSFEATQKIISLSEASAPRRLQVIFKLRNWSRGVYATSAGNSYRLHHCCWHITPPSWQDACCDVGFSIAARIVGSGHASISVASFKLQIPRWALRSSHRSSKKVNEDEVPAWDAYYLQI